MYWPCCSTTISTGQLSGTDMSAATCWRWMPRTRGWYAGLRESATSGTRIGSGTAPSRYLRLGPRSGKALHIGAIEESDPTCRPKRGELSPLLQCNDSGRADPQDLGRVQLGEKLLHLLASLVD